MHEKIMRKNQKKVQRASLLLLLLYLTFTMSHKIITFLLEVNGKPAFVLFLQVGNTGDVEQDLTEVVLVNRGHTPVSDVLEELACI